MKMAIGSIELGEGALRVLGAHYLRRFPERGTLETPLEFFARIARKVSEGELFYGNVSDAHYYEEVFLSALTKFEFLPSPQLLLNIGIPGAPLFSSLGLKIDARMIDGIFDVFQTAAKFLRHGCQVSFGLTNSPEVQELTGMEPTGVLAALTSLAGSIRKPAAAISLTLDVAYLPAFSATPLAKISSNWPFICYAAITPKFARALKRNARYEVYDPETCSFRKMRVEDLLREFLTSTKDLGGPSYVFLEAVGSGTSAIPDAVTPCGDNFLRHQEACISGSVNIAKCLREKDERTVIDWEEFARVIRIAIRFLDDAFEISTSPPDSEISTARSRKLSLGIIGFGEALLKMGIPYESEATLKIAEKIATFFRKVAEKESQRLAEERGIPQGSSFGKGKRMRHSTLLGIAPNAEVSVIAGTSPGLEPASCLLLLLQEISGNSDSLDVEHIFGGDLRIIDMLSADVLKILFEKGKFADSRFISDEVKALFPTLLDVDPLFHLRLQSVFQRNIDGGVYKIIPSPETLEDMVDIFVSASLLGVKTLNFLPIGTERRKGRKHLCPYRCEGFTGNSRIKGYEGGLQ